MALHGHVVLAAVVIGAVLVSITSVSSIKCYTCENMESNTMCNTASNLLECESGMDTCQTIVTFSDVSEKLSIIKTCTKNVSCDLQINATRDDTPCDKSLDSWICTSCCYDDACNVDGANTNHVSGLFLTIPIIALGLSKMFIQ